MRLVTFNVEMGFPNNNFIEIRWIVSHFNLSDGKSLPPVTLLRCFVKMSLECKTAPTELQL